MSYARTRNTAGGNNEENLAGKTGRQGFSTQGLPEISGIEKGS